MDRSKELCLKLIHSDTEREVITHLKEAGFWDDKSLWRDLGDNENNFAITNNQSSKSDAALVEKLVNSVDARLMNECIKAGIDPEGPKAPTSIRYAVAKFIEKAEHPEKEFTGRISEWTDQERTKVAADITLCATGSKRRPCFSIADLGEGQTPEKVPVTFLSLNKSNKLRIHFVQGKFNMGGTGVLRFCGEENLQLIVTRRDPAIVRISTSNPDDSLWSFTVVRRDNPSSEKNSVYRYLAPLNADSSRKGGILRFAAESLKIFPDKNKPYEREASWGSLIKLYEYNAKGFSSHILMKDGLLSRMDLLLPDPALPIRFHECRNYKGHEGSFDTTLTGVCVRLDDDKARNLEQIPTSSKLMIQGQSLSLTIYVFKKGKAGFYKKNEGVLFTVNGQTHGIIPHGFFKRNDVGLSYLANSLLIKIDCSKLARRAHEDLFMNSRDRLCADSPLRDEILKSLAQLLKKNESLRKLKNKRRDEEIKEKLKDDKPLENTLKNILRSNPTLTALFLTGEKLSDPFQIKKVKSKEKEEFIGKNFPTFFKFRGKPAGAVLFRDCHLDTQCRIFFETDVENTYFDRAVKPGEVTVKQIKENGKCDLPYYIGPSLNNGIASLTFDVPKEARPNDILEFEFVITDETQVEPFINICRLAVRPKIEMKPKPPRPPKPPEEEPGEDRTLPSGISLPNIIRVKKEEWDRYDPKFDKYTALRAKDTGEEGSTDVSLNKKAFDFFINEGNFYLEHELKRAPGEEEIIKSQFLYGLVLVGLAVLHSFSGDESGKQNSENDVDVEKQVEIFSSALAPFLIPMIRSLGMTDIISEAVKEEPFEEVA